MDGNGKAANRTEQCSIFPLTITQTHPLYKMFVYCGEKYLLRNRNELMEWEGARINALAST
jgi:hypothetical protein